MSKHARYMTTKELLDRFGVGRKGNRRVSGDMVAWLLTDPPQVALDAAGILKQPITRLPEVRQQSEPVEFRGFSFGAGNPSTD